MFTGMDGRTDVGLRVLTAMTVMVAGFWVIISCTLLHR
jgi:hypothetical protein